MSNGIVITGGGNKKVIKVISKAIRANEELSIGMRNLAIAMEMQAHANNKALEAIMKVCESPNNITISGCNFQMGNKDIGVTIK